MRLLPLLLVFALALTGCDRERSALGPDCKKADVEEDLAGVSLDLPYEEWGELTESDEDDRDVQLELVSQLEVVELHPVISRDLLDADYEILSADNEGFESEIFFARGEDVLGSVRLREQQCSDAFTLVKFDLKRKR